MDRESIEDLSEKIRIQLDRIHSRTQGEITTYERLAIKWAFMSIRAAAYRGIEVVNAVPGDKSPPERPEDAVSRPPSEGRVLTLRPSSEIVRREPREGEDKG